MSSKPTITTISVDEFMLKLYTIFEKYTIHDVNKNAFIEEIRSVYNLYNYNHIANETSDQYLYYDFIKYLRELFVKRHRILYGFNQSNNPTETEIFHENNKLFEIAMGYYKKHIRINFQDYYNLTTIPKKDENKILNDLKKKFYFNLLSKFDDFDFISFNEINEIIHQIGYQQGLNDGNRYISDRIREGYNTYLAYLIEDVKNIKYMIYLKLLGIIYISEREEQDQKDKNYITEIDLNKYKSMFVYFFSFNTASTSINLNEEELKKIKENLFSNYSGNPESLKIPINMDIIIFEMREIMKSLYNYKFNIIEFYNYILRNKFNKFLTNILSALISNIHLNHGIILNDDSYNSFKNMSISNYSEYVTREDFDVSSNELKNDIEVLIYFYELFYYNIPNNNGYFQYLIDYKNYKLDITFSHILNIYHALEFYQKEMPASGGKKINKKRRILKKYLKK